MLSQGIYCKLDGKPAKQEFLHHIDQYYTPFCAAALRAMCIYGFVPWRMRKLPKGDIIPEVLPMGTFSWHAEPRTKDKELKAHYGDNSTALVIYRVTPTSGMFKEEDVYIYVFQTPSLDIMNNSILYATVQSPLAHLLTDYKALRQGLIRRSHADAWNTTAKIITEFSPKLRVEDNPSQYLMDFVHEDYYQPPPGGESMYPQLEAHNVWQREQVIRRQFSMNPSTHLPEVFALPRDHTVAQQTKLEPCEDIEFLQAKYKGDVCAVLGVPLEMISGKQGGAVGIENTKKTQATGRIFSTNMQYYCKHVQFLLQEVYSTIYNDKSDCEFLLVPLPRLEISSIEDLKALHEIGALTPDMSMQLSKTLLGEGTRLFKKQKKSDSTSMSDITQGFASSEDRNNPAEDPKDNKPTK